MRSFLRLSHRDWRLVASSAGLAVAWGWHPKRYAEAESWKRNLLFQPPSGFWSDDAWYDAQLHRRLPLAETMLQQIVWALPPISGKRVADLGSGTGRSAAAIATAYPAARLTLLDPDGGRGAIALQRLSRDGHAQAHFICSAVAADGSTLPGSSPADGGPYDCVVAVQAVRHIVAPPAHYAAKLGLATVSTEEEIRQGYRRIFQGIFQSLLPGGHVFIGDHVVHGHPGVFEHCLLLHDLGFVDVDVAWRDKDWFVVGARRPPE